MAIQRAQVVSFMTPELPPPPPAKPPPPPAPLSPPLAVIHASNRMVPHGSAPAPPSPPPFEPVPWSPPFPPGDVSPWTAPP
ncbi:MAG TPA: hypothetical protein DEG88_07975 [Propionibacteriaceae bacterium]|nr:hypothetical protein [Propionibacteriaceae bacterium]